jgi:hypothetical protein
MATDLKNFETRINSLVDEAIDSVADNILNDMGIKEEDDPNYVKYYEVYEDIQKYLIEKWKKEINDRRMKQKLNKVAERVEDQITNPKYNAQDNGTMCFTTTEEASKAAEILEGKGYETEMDYDEGYEQVKYWKPGHEPEPEYL